MKATAEALGMMTMMKDMGLEVSSAVVALDSAAALGVINRQGIGKIRHLDVGELWLQQRELKKEVSFRKVPGEKNAGDAMTKPVTREVFERHAAFMGYQWTTGRATTAARLHSLNGLFEGEQGWKTEVQEEEEESQWHVEYRLFRRSTTPSGL